MQSVKLRLNLVLRHECSVCQATKQSYITHRKLISLALESDCLELKVQTKLTSWTQTWKKAQFKYSGCVAWLQLLVEMIFVLHCYSDSSLADSKLWLRPGRQAGGMLGFILRMAWTPTRPQNTFPRGQTSGLDVAVRYWPCFLNLSKLALCKENCLGYQFQNALPMGNLFLKWSPCGHRWERADSSQIWTWGWGWAMHLWVERKPRRGNPSHVVHLDPWLCHRTWTKPQCFGLSIPPFILLQPGRNLGFWIYH